MSAEIVNLRTPLHRRVMRGVLWPITGSSSLPLVQLDWQPIRPEQLERGPDPVVFHTKSGDPNAGLLPRSCENVGILAVPADALELSKAAYPDYVEGVVRQTMAGLRAAYLPEGVSFAHEELYPDLRLFGLRLGRGPIHAALTLMSRDRQAIEPEGVHWLRNATFSAETISQDMPRMSVGG